MFTVQCNWVVQSIKFHLDQRRWVRVNIEIVDSVYDKGKGKIHIGDSVVNERNWSESIWLLVVTAYNLQVVCLKENLAITWTHVLHK